MKLVQTLKFIWTHPLNRKGKVRAVGRFARWQAASRLMRGPVPLPFVYDTGLVTEPGITGAIGN